MSYRVIVTDRLVPALTGQAGCHYISPPQTEQQARTLIRVLTGAPTTPDGPGPWSRALAGGTREIELVAA